MLVSLASLQDNLVELSLSFAQGGHVNAIGRVRVVIGQYSHPSVWVGELCLPINVGVKPCSYDNAKGNKFNLYQNRDGSWPVVSE